MQLAGLKLPVPLVVKPTVPVGVTAVPGEESVTVAVHVACWFTTTELGVQLTETKTARLSTVREKVVVLTSPPEAVPVMVTVNVPVDTVGLADMARVEVMEPSAGGVTGLALNAPVTPAGSPPMVRVTG